MFGHSENSNKVVIFPKVGTLSEAARHLGLILEPGSVWPW